MGSEVDVPQGPGEAPAAEPRVITAAPVRPGRLVARVVTLLALAGLLVTCVLFLVAARAALDLADDVRAALGVDPPASGVDWYRLAVLVVVFAVPVLAALWLARVVRRRYRRRLAERLGDAAPARRFTPGRRFDRKQWLAVLLTTPYWAPRLERWRGQGAVPAGDEGWSDDDYRQVATRLGMRQNTLAVAVHRMRERLRELIRLELFDTMAQGSDVDAELDILRQTLGGSTR